MELLRLIFFSTAYYYLDSSYFLNLVLFSLLIKSSYKFNDMTLLISMNPFIITMSLLNIFVNNLLILFHIIKKYKYINKIISFYLILNNWFLSKINTMINYILFRLIKTVSKSKRVKINDFLDKLES